MGSQNRKTHRQGAHRRSRMPENSLFYEKIIPGLLIGMLVVMTILILFAGGILLGLITF